MKKILLTIAFSICSIIVFGDCHDQFTEAWNDANENYNNGIVDCMNRLKPGYCIREEVVIFHNAVDVAGDAYYWCVMTNRTGGGD